MAKKASKTPTKTGEAKPAAAAADSQNFRFTAPAATSVLLAGDFTEWQEQPIPMTRDDQGVWIAAVMLAPGTYHYRFIVDGGWCDDPECPRRAPTPFGSENAVRVVV